MSRESFRAFLLLSKIGCKLLPMSLLGPASSLPDSKSLSLVLSCLGLAPVPAAPEQAELSLLGGLTLALDIGVNALLIRILDYHVRVPRLKAQS